MPSGITVFKGVVIMKKYLSVILSVIMLFTTMSPCYAVIAAEIEQNNVQSVSDKVCAMSDEYNKEYEEKLESSEAESLTVDNRLIVETKSKINTYDSVDEVYGLGYAFIQFDNEKDAQKAASQYEKQGLTVQNDKIYNLSATSSTSSESDWAYQYSEADTTLKYFKNNNNPQIIVGIIDSGIWYDHSKMKDRVIRTYTNFSTSYIGDRENDEHGHGTNVAGVIAQSTPDNVKLSAFKVADAEGHIYTSNLICAYEYILAMKENQPDIINMSYGGYEPESPIEKNLLKELKDSGIALIAAAGNENVDTKDSSPANNENVLAVSAYDESGNKCWFSNYGSTVDIAAPGANVKTYKVANTTSYDYVNGTSFSSPFVAAAASYVLMQDTSRTPDDIYKILKDSAVKRNKASDRMWAGAGLLNFSNLIEGERKSDVIFNYESGTYDDTIKVELSCADKLNTKIVYTTDGTLPSSSNGSTYRNAIEVDSHATIIAAAFPIIGSSMHSKYIINNYQIFRNADENDFEITDEGVITAYNGKYTAIRVPDTIKGTTPLQIGVGCFMNSDIVNIELPDTIYRIDYDAFNESALERIVGLGVTEISSRTFKNCYSLYEENMPNITYLSFEAFYGCNLLTELTFADKLEYAYEECFSGTGLKKADFPNLISEAQSFENTPITYANLPKITNLDGGFKDCKMLKEINIPNVTKIGKYAFANCISLPKEMDFTDITELKSHAFSDSQFEKLDLPNCLRTGGYAFENAAAKTINIPNCKKLGGSNFAGSSLEYVNMEGVENIVGGDWEFRNCFSLKYVYAPNSKQVPTFGTDDDGKYELSQGKTPALEFIYAPKATEFNHNYCDIQEFTNLKFIYAPKLESIANFIRFPEKDDFTLYLSDSLKVGSNQEGGINGKYTVVAPTGSFAEQWAKKKWFYYPDGLNFIPSDSRAVDENNKDLAEGINTHAKGKSICTSVAGLRFGFDWTAIPEIEELASNIEYGFIYSQKGAENLSIDTVDNKNVKQLVANNRVTNGDNTSFNLVISNIPSSYYGRDITARAYICIDGMYFYSNVQKASFKSVADLVLADDEIDLSTKNAVKNLLAKEA